MTSIAGQRVGDPAIDVARHREDVAVGEEIVRHKLSVRFVHWSVAATFLLSLISGLPIWTPVFGWMAGLLGGLSVCRVLHPYAGLLFFGLSGALFAQWIGRMRLERDEWGWLGPRLVRYMRWDVQPHEHTGKYNGGQKVYFWAVSLGALVLLLSGVVLWFPTAVSAPLHWAAVIVHDVTFVVFTVGLVFHVYLGSAAEPGTFRSMVRGTVTRDWARFHHPGWYEEVTGEEVRRER